VVLAGMDCLRHVPQAELNSLLSYGFFRALPGGTPVFGWNRQRWLLSIVLYGTLELHMIDREGREVLMGILGRGDCCGEGPLFGDFFRRTTAVTQSDCYLFQLPIDELRSSLESLPMVTVALRTIYKRRLIEATLARVPVLSQLPPLERVVLADLLQERHISRGSFIMHEGEPADALYLIESGQATVEQQGHAIATLSEGDFFGEMALLSQQPHGADIRAQTPTDVLILPERDFHALMDRRPDIKDQLHSVIERRLQQNASIHGSARARDLKLAVEGGLLRGSHLLVRTPSLCEPGCRICAQACAERHGQARLAWPGVRVNGFDVADACRQCSVGAECIEVCPAEAFDRSDDGVVLITDRCIGCGKCVEACPYDAVASVALSPAHPKSNPLLTLLKQTTERLRRSSVIPLEAVPTHRADKCDLCHGYNDLACVRACPTGALRLAPVEEIFPL
jgi:CRP-like cAMP-binding protein/Fe-S-cluster-containing hydrogenase component 2